MILVHCSKPGKDEEPRNWRFLASLRADPSSVLLAESPPVGTTPMSTRSCWTCLAVTALAGCATVDVAKDYSTSQMTDGSMVIAVTVGASPPSQTNGPSAEPQDRIEAAAARECKGAYKILSAKSTVNIDRAPVYTLTRSAVIRCNPAVPK